MAGLRSVPAQAPIIIRLGISKHDELEGYVNGLRVIGRNPGQALSGLLLFIALIEYEGLIAIAVGSYLIGHYREVPADITIGILPGLNILG